MILLELKRRSEDLESHQSLMNQSDRILRMPAPLEQDKSLISFLELINMNKAQGPQESFADIIEDFDL